MVKMNGEHGGKYKFEKKKKQKTKLQTNPNNFYLWYL